MTTEADQIIEAMARAIHAIEGHSDWDGNLHEENTAWGTGKAVRRAEARTALTAAYTALEAQGWRVVPVEPTEQQTEAADRAMSRRMVQGPEKWATLDAGLRAFLAAAPRPPGTEPSRASARETSGEGGV